ncbi:MAG: class I SAM-dependent methyltransferase [Vicinamibacterales bacterium]
MTPFRWLLALVRFPMRAAALLARGDGRIQQGVSEARRAAKRAQEALKKTDALRSHVKRIDENLRVVHEELGALRRELRQGLLQNTMVLTRLSRAVAADTPEAPEPPRLSGRTVPFDASDVPAPKWQPVGAGVAPPDPEGREWIAFDLCPSCGHDHFTIVCPWNKLILLEKAPDASSVHYNYALCHACGVLFASRRPCGERYRFLLAHFGEVTAKRGGTAEITNRVLNPYPLSDAEREELRRLAARGVFVSDHLGLRNSEWLAPLLRDRFENSAHVDIISALVPLARGARVLEVRSRAGTILDGLRRASGLEVYAMPMWESQQFLLREVYGIETSDLIDFDRFTIPFDGPFDIIICNHMFTHVLRPREFFAELRARLAPGGHVYLHNEPDDAEFVAGKQSMLATLNPLHVQAFDQASLVRALAANGFEPVFSKHQKNQTHLCLARLSGDARLAPMADKERDARLDAYRRAFDRAVLGVDEHLRPRMAAAWSSAVERAVGMGVAEFDDRGRLRLVTRP